MSNFEQNVTQEVTREVPVAEIERAPLTKEDVADKIKELKERLAQQINDIDNTSDMDVKALMKRSTELEGDPHALQALEDQLDGLRRDQGHLAGKAQEEINKQLKYLEAVGVAKDLGKEQKYNGVSFESLLTSDDLKRYTLDTIRLQGPEPTYQQWQGLEGILNADKGAFDADLFKNSVIGGIDRELSHNKTSNIAQEIPQSLMKILPLEVLNKISESQAKSLARFDVENISSEYRAAFLEDMVAFSRIPEIQTLKESALYNKFLERKGINPSDQEGLKSIPSASGVYQEYVDAARKIVMDVAEKSPAELSSLFGVDETQLEGTLYGGRPADYGAANLAKLFESGLFSRKEIVGLLASISASVQDGAQNYFGKESLGAIAGLEAAGKLSGTEVAEIVEGQL